MFKVLLSSCSSLEPLILAEKPCGYGTWGHGGGLNSDEGMVALGDLKNFSRLKYSMIYLSASLTFIIQVVVARSSYSSCPHLFIGFIFLKQLTEPELKH